MSYIHIRSYTLFKIKEITGIEVDIASNTYSSCFDSQVVTIKTKKSLNTNNKAIISHNTEGEFFIKRVDDPYNESIKIKLGKILQAISSNPLTPEEIEYYISKWKKAYTIDTSIVETSDDIPMVYNLSECGGSCMAHKGELMNIYSHFGCKIAYITNDYDELVARAILWYDINYIEPSEEMEKSKFIDRIFFEKEEYKLTLQKWAKENSYKTFTSNSDYIYYTDSKPLNQFENGVPYLDTLYVVGYNDDTMFLSSSDDVEALWFDELRQTNGTSDNGDFGSNNGIYCEDVGDYLPEDETIYIEIGDYYVSNDYEYLAYVEEWNMYIDTDNDSSGVVFAEDEERWIPAEDAYYCVDRDQYYKYNDDLYFCVDSGEYYGDNYDLYFTKDTEEYYENNDTLYYCEDTGNYFASDDSIFITEDSSEYYENSGNLYYILEVDEYYVEEENYNERLKELKNV